MTDKQLNQIKGYLNIAKKAGFVIVGQDNLKNYNKKLYLVLYTEPTNNIVSVINGIKSTTMYQSICLEKHDFDTVTNIENCKIIALKNKAISDKIIELIRGEVN